MKKNYPLVLPFDLCFGDIKVAKNLIAFRAEYIFWTIFGDFELKIPKNLHFQCRLMPAAQCRRHSALAEIGMPSEFGIPRHI